jgi:hypothetical protein
MAFIEQRLRVLGATYYLLEKWGEDHALYRFQCKMMIARDPKHNRHFEATDPDRVRAMERALGQIEAWCAGSGEAISH